MNRLIALFFMVVSMSAWADAVGQLKAFFKSTHAMRASFHQLVVDQQGRKIQDVKGTMQLERPNKFRWDYQKPYEQQIVCDGQQVYLYDVDLEQVTVRDLSQTLGFSPAALLAGDEDVEKNFTLKNATRKDGLSWVLALPKSKESGFDRVLLGFEGDALRQLELYDSFSHITKIKFDHVEQNPKLDSNSFVFKAPKGVDVVGE